MNAPRRLRPVPLAPPRDSSLLFCAVCQVSIAAAEVESGAARRTPKGRLFCAVCVEASPQERQRRREALEDEFADDAPLPKDAPAGKPQAASAARPALGDDPILELRVGELERSAFRLQARVRALEERLDAMSRVVR